MIFCLHLRYLILTECYRNNIFLFQFQVTWNGRNTWYNAFISITTYSDKTSLYFRLSTGASVHISFKLWSGQCISTKCILKHQSDTRIILSQVKMNTFSQICPYVFSKKQKKKKKEAQGVNTPYISRMYWLLPAKKQHVSKSIRRDYTEYGFPMEIFLQDKQPMGKVG